MFWFGGAVVLLALGAYLLFWPVRIEPQAWQAPPDPGLTGAFAENEALKNAQRLFADQVTGADFIQLGAEGRLLSALADGRVVAMDPAAGTVQGLGLSPGRPLGFVQTGEFMFVLANPAQGLGASIKRRHFPLSTEAAGTPFRYVSDVALTATGELYFTDASSKYGLGDTYSDFLEHGANGRLLKFDDLSRTTTVVRSGLYFPGGLALGPNDEYLLIAETSAYRVLRYWLTGDKKGTTEVFIEHLPGFPAHITWNGSDRFWLALYAPRIRIFDRGSDAPGLRKLLYRLPRFLQPKPAKRAWVLGLDLDGRVRHNLQYAGKDAFAPVTSVREHEGWLYLGSLTATGIARVPVPPR